ncbi:MAG: biotin--[acetyl-CoA-carboxylase] ligase [Oscillospiraceae bacterium]|nr:biotin--[acetyl-CoA-carboxylase] ligase [Oscillospiraceae bacterium]
MNVKQEVLNIFETNKGTCISGAQLAAQLGVSRNAVWKAVKSLQEEGYRITAVTNKGYTLSSDNDILSPQSISKYLTDDAGPFNIEVYKTISSTNSVLKSLASDGAAEGKVIISGEQTQGRGRLNRSFYSPMGTGIYMSILLRPKMTAADSLFITTSAAVAVAEAIEAIAEKDAKIKWVNDIYCGDKKVSGILTEASLDLEGGGLEYAVLGIGINVLQPCGGFPEELKDIATSVFNDTNCPADLKSKLVAAILNRFWNYYKCIENKAFLKAYIQRSMIVGNEIYIFGNNTCEQAFATKIDDQCRLWVRMQDGTEKALSSGEVSIRKG